ncbi:MAG: hypothetical protein ACTSUS_08995 [Candidatus Freyarchaeota archaeon]|nr:hypothetical protein [Candidatus Freyrarchaeum guaymaensis]
MISLREKQEGLSEQDKASALMVLKDYGEKRWSEKWMSHISFPSTIDVLNDKEDVLRYMLLRALINQQAKVEKARQLPKRLYEEFTETLLYSPWEIDPYRLFDILVDVAGEKGSDLYKVGALGGIKPTSLFLYRFYSFTLYIKTLGNIKLYNIIKNFSSPYGIHMYFKNNTFLSAGWVGNDPKACRMLADWITFLFEEVWKENVKFKLKDSLMIVDGHVGKVFSRSGLIENVYYEKKRPYIIQAAKMRSEIERLVKQYNFTPFYVDNGAFYLFEDGYCNELNPKCNECPLTIYCKKYVKWTAYQQLK